MARPLLALLILVGLAAIGYILYVMATTPEEPPSTCEPIPWTEWKGGVYPGSNWVSGSIWKQDGMTQCDCEHKIMNDLEGPGGVYRGDTGLCMIKGVMGQSSWRPDAGPEFISYRKFAPAYN